MKLPRFLNVASGQCDEASRQTTPGAFDIEQCPAGTEGRQFDFGPCEGDCFRFAAPQQEGGGDNEKREVQHRSMAVSRDTDFPFREAVVASRTVMTIVRWGRWYGCEFYN